jgi:hypothetical protein
VDEDTRSFLVDSLRLEEHFALTIDETVPPITVNAQQVQRYHALFSLTNGSNLWQRTFRQLTLGCSMQLCALPLQRTRDLWRSYMLAFAEQLQKWQGNAQSPAAMRLVSLRLAEWAHASAGSGRSCAECLNDSLLYLPVQSRLFYEAYQLWMALHSIPHRMRVTQLHLRQGCIADVCMTTCFVWGQEAVEDAPVCGLQDILEQADRLKEGPLQLPLPHEQLVPGVHHQRMLAAARLSTQQRSVLSALHRALLTNFGRLQGRRARCVAQLQVGSTAPAATVVCVVALTQRVVCALPRYASHVRNVRQSHDNCTGLSFSALPVSRRWFRPQQSRPRAPQQARPSKAAETCEPSSQS